MKTPIKILLYLGILLLLPGLAWADCMELGGFTSFTLEGENTIVLYVGSAPYAKFDVADCDVQSTSTIQLLKSYMCDGDELLIDGERCSILNIRSAD
jgi:hypothetical protein